MNRETNPHHFLHYQPKDIISVADTLNGQIIPPGEIIAHLENALEILIHTDGPNLSYRQQHAREFIGPWIDIITELERQNVSNRLQHKVAHHLYPHPQAIGQYLETMPQYAFSSGGIFMGGGEGTPAHRACINHINCHTNFTVILLSAEHYKKDRGLFFPRSLTLTLWAYYLVHTDHAGAITLLNDPLDDQEKTDKYYQNVFAQSGCRYCFTSAVSPLANTQMSRGEYAPVCLIPHVEEPRTGQYVTKLMENAVDNPSLLHIMLAELHPINADKLLSL